MSNDATLGVIFDLDGTLVESAPAIMAVGNRFLDTLGLEHMDLRETISYIGGGSEQYVRLMLEAREAYDEQSFAERFASFMGLYNASSPELNRPFAGVDDALRGLRARGLSTAVCTNKPEIPTHKLIDFFGWTELFDAVVGGDTLEVKKPDPSPLHEAARRLGCDAFVFVGDSEVDAETARRANAPFVLFDKGYRKTPVDELPHTALLSDYSQLGALLEEKGWL